MAAFGDIGHNEIRVLKYSQLFHDYVTFCLTVYDVPSINVWATELRSKGLSVLRTNSKLVSRSSSFLFGRSLGASSLCIFKSIDIRSSFEFSNFYSLILSVLANSTEIGFDSIFFSCAGRIYNTACLNSVLINIRSPVTFFLSVFNVFFQFFRCYHRIISSPFLCFYASRTDFKS